MRHPAPAAPLHLALLLAAATCVLLPACGSGGALVLATDASGEPLTAASFAPGVRHSWFPLVPGSRWVYVGEEQGQAKREEVVVAPALVRIAGVLCAAVEQRVLVEGVHVETTTEWFAQDRRGTIWKFGEESFELVGGVFERKPDSWVTGRDEAQAWMAFPAVPVAGMTWVGARPDGADLYEVLSLAALADTPLGPFPDCLEIAENPGDVEDEDIILYSAGLGRVAESSASGWLALLEHSVP